MVTVDPVGIEEGAVITIGIQDVIGANVGNPGIVSLTLQTYGGGVNSGDSGGNGGNDGNVTLVSTWSAALNGDPYTEDGDDWVDLTMNTSGIKYYGVEALFSGELEEYYTDVAGLIASWDEYIADYLTNGYTVTDVLFADGEYTYIEYPGEGAAQIYIVEFDATGKTTGRYGVSSVVFPEYEGGSGGGELEWEKTTVGVPATFTKNTSLGVEYQGRYTDGDDTGDIFSATGTGESMWAIDVFAPNAFDGDVHAYAADLAAYIEQSLADLVEEYGADLVSSFYEDLADFLAYEVLGTYEGEPFLFDTYENGTYDALVLTFTADGDLTGEYNLVKVTVDGHEYVEPAGAPAHIKVAARRLAPSQAKRAVKSLIRHK